MPQLPAPQKSKDIGELISMFNLLEKGEEIFFEEESFIELIDYFIIQNNIQKAFSVLGKAFNVYPDSYEILLSEAQLLIETDLNTTASKKLKKLYKQTPNDMSLIMLIAINYTKLAIINKAMMFFDKALSMIKNKNKELLLYSIAQTFIQVGRNDVGAFYLTKAYQLAPNDKRIILDLAFCLERTKKFKKSEKLYKIYLKKDPFSKLAWYNLGVVLVAEQKIDEAVQAFDYSCAIDDKFSSPIFNKAELLFQIKKYKKATEEFSKLLEIEKFNASALYFRGISYLEQNNIKAAISDLKKSLKIQKDNPEAWYALAEIYFLSNNLNKAKKALYYTLDLEKINSKYWKLAADIFVQEKKFKLVKKSFLQAIAADPFIDEYWFEYCDFLVKHKNYNDAISELNKGKEFISDTITFLIKLSSLYLLVNDKVNAIENFKNVSSICENALSKLKSIHPNKKQIKILTEI